MSYYKYLIRKVENSDFLENPDLYSNLIQAPFLNEVIRDVLKKRDLLEEIARKSYTHSNGFDKIVLFESENLKLRLHIWDRTIQESESFEENIHNHRWDFITILLTGGYILRIYQENKTGQKHFYYHYNSPKNTQTYSLDYVGVKKIKLIGKTQFDKGNTFVYYKELLHTVSAIPNEFTISLVLHYKESNDKVKVFSTESILNNQTITAKRFDVDQISTKLEKAQMYLEQETKSLQRILNEYQNNHELIDLVNENDEEIGKATERHEVYEKKQKNYRVVNAFLQNDNGELLILKRQGHKSLFPSALDMSVGGHVKSGEDYLTALRREALEELNIDIEKTGYEEIGYFNPFKVNISSFTKSFLIKTNNTPEYNKEEFQDHYWLKPLDILNKIENNNEVSKDDLPVLIKLLFI